MDNSVYSSAKEFLGSIDTAMKGLHRVVTTEIHYVIHGIVSTGLRAPEEFVTYLTSMATQTLALLWEFTDLGVREIRGKAEEIVTEYRAFVRESYEVVTADVDVDAVNKNVVAQFRGEIDLFRLVSPNTDLILCVERLRSEVLCRYMDNHLKTLLSCYSMSR
ncbi:hypothetical protein ABNG02_13975 [Halorubrum ejinorense]|uniref:Uncharacterized protein n=1 Tax=Halorubrum ejinorense TaxID=425309 RepID=A0AAV3SQM7_9EURY